MAVIHWVGGSSSHFNDPANWSPPQVPGIADDVIIDPVGAVSLDSPANTTINSLSLVATATLTIVGGTSFTVNDGTSYSSADTIRVRASDPDTGGGSSSSCGCSSAPDALGASALVAIFLGLPLLGRRKEQRIA